MVKRIIMHLDANSAYLSWAAADRLQHGDALDLRTIPSVVGGKQETRHGIVLTKSIPAKRYGIQTGETLYSARQKCPGLIVVPPDYGLYMQCSQAFGDILRQYSPLVEQYSIDEYFMDYTEVQHLYGDPAEAACRIKDRIRNELGFTVNVGISTNKLLAKMGSELKKPDMVHTLFPWEMEEKMWPLPVRELFMVGGSTEKKLHERGIRTIGDLAHAAPERIQSFLKSHGLLVWNYANGRDTSPVHLNRRPVIKGIGNSCTTPFDARDRKTAHMVLLSLSETVAARLRAGGYCARLVSVSFKTNEFYNCSHQRKFYEATDSTNAIYKVACELFGEIWRGQPLRHFGVSTSELCGNDFRQPNLFEDTEKQRRIDQTVDAIRERFGSNAIFRSNFVGSGMSGMLGGTGDMEEYPMMSSYL